MSHVTCHLSPVTNANSQSHCYLPHYAQKAGSPIQIPKTQLYKKKMFENLSFFFLVCHFSNMLFDKKSPDLLVQDADGVDKHTNKQTDRHTSQRIA